MAVLGQAMPQSSDNIAFEGGYDPILDQVAAKELDSSQTANGSTYGPQRVVISGMSGYIATAASQPSSTTANTDVSWSFAQRVNHVMIQNNTGAAIQFELDATATPGSPIIPASSTYFLDIKATSVHLYVPSVVNINGTTAGNIVIRGWL